MYVAWVDSAGTVIILDTYSNIFDQPDYDSQQDLYGVSGSSQRCHYNNFLPTS